MPKYRVSHECRVKGSQTKIFHSSILRNSKYLVRYSISAVLLVLGCTILAAQDTKDEKPKCLTCHGPFEKLVKAPAKFKANDDETVNPHKYIPHDSQDAPQCTECHFVEHETPLKDKASVVKPKNVNYCYDSCHHAKNLKPCKDCH